MAQECGFFNAELNGNTYDRVYLAATFAAYFASFIGNGVFGNSMQQLRVLEQDTPKMSVKVGTGQAWINGYWYRNNAEYTLDLSIADGTLSRIDLIVLRWDNSARDMYLKVIKGDTSANPIEPSFSRGADYYDLVLAKVKINAGATSITQSAITDTRLDNNYCGLVTGVVDQIDTTDLYNQFETYFNEFKKKYEDGMDDWTDDQKKALADYIQNTKDAYDAFVKQKSDDYDSWTQEKKDQYSLWYDQHIALWQKTFDDWFAKIQSELAGDVAANLQLQLNEHEDLLNNLAKMLIQNKIEAPCETSAGEILVTSEGEALMFDWSYEYHPCNCAN